MNKILFWIRNLLSILVLVLVVLYSNNFIFKNILFISLYVIYILVTLKDIIRKKNVFMFLFNIKTFVSDVNLANESYHFVEDTAAFIDFHFLVDLFLAVFQRGYIDRRAVPFNIYAFYILAVPEGFVAEKSDSRGNGQLPELSIFKSHDRHARNTVRYAENAVMTVISQQHSRLARSKRQRSGISSRKIIYSLILLAEISVFRRDLHMLQRARKQPAGAGVERVVSDKTQRRGEDYGLYVRTEPEKPGSELSDRPSVGLPGHCDDPPVPLISEDAHPFVSLFECESRSSHQHRYLNTRVSGAGSPAASPAADLRAHSPSGSISTAASLRMSSCRRS